MKTHLVAILGFALAAALGAASGCASENPAEGATATADEAIVKSVVVPAAAPVTFQLAGGDVRIYYGVYADGPVFVYDDGKDVRTFLGNEVRTSVTDLGTMVSVTLPSTVATVGRSVSLLVPRVEKAASASLVVDTEVIVATHERPFIVPYTGQLDRYEATALHGVASNGM